MLSLIAPDDAWASTLHALLSAVPSADGGVPPVRVALHPADLSRAPRGARVVFVRPERFAGALNLWRPNLVYQRLQLILWCDPEGFSLLQSQAPDLTSWISSRFYLPPRAPRFVEEALAVAERLIEPLTLVGPATPPPGFAVWPGDVEPDTLAHALAAGPVWVEGGRDVLDTFTQLAVWAESPRHALVLHDPPVAVDVAPRLDARPCPWVEATALCVGQAPDDPGALAAQLDLDPRALGLPPAVILEVVSARFYALFLGALNGQRHAELAKFLGLHALAARWRGGEAPRVDAPTPEVEGRWAVLGPLGVAPPSEPGDAGHRATPQGALGEALNEPLRALSEASPVEALVVVEPMATPPSLAGERVAELVISRVRAALGVRWRAVYLPSGAGLAARLGISLLPKARAQVVDLNRVHEALGWMSRAAESSVRIGGDAAFFALRDELRRLQDAGRHAEALQRLEAELLPWAATLTDDVQLVGETWQLIGRARAALDDLEGALVALQDEALPRLERVGDVRLQLDALLGLADVLARRGDHDAALQLLNGRILPWAQRLGEIGIVGRARVQRVELIAALGQPEEVLRAQQDDVRAFSELLREPAVVANVRALINTMLHGLDHQSDEALRTLREGVLPLVQRSGDVRAAAVVQHNIARILTARGLLDEALQVYQAEVLPVFRRLGEKRLVAETLNEIAGVYLGQGRRRKALRLCEEELAPLVADLGDKYLQTRLSSRLVQLFSAMGRLDEALRSLQEVVLPWLREHGPPEQALAAEANIAGLQLQRGTPEDLAAARTSLPNIEAAAQAQGLTELLKKVQPMMSTLGIAPTAPPSPSERTKG